MKRTTNSSHEEPGNKAQKLGEDAMVAATSRDDVSRPEELCMHRDYWDEDGALLDQDLVKQARHDAREDTHGGA